MLITDADTLQKYLPSSVYDDTDSLVVLTERAERKHIIPVLGEKLFKYIVKAMPFTVGDDVPGIYDIIPNDTDVKNTLKKLTELCQSAVAFFTVADNAGQLSLSFNMGNGLAQVNTEGYTAATEESMKRFLADVWHQAKQDVDDICTMLEQLSMAAPSTAPSTTQSDYKLATVLRKIADYWKESEWFYFNGDLLLTTAREAKRYVTQAEHPFFYKEYVEMLGEMRARQEANVMPELGDELTDALIKSQYTNGVFSNAAAKTEKGKMVIQKTLRNLRMALMSFVRFARTNKPIHENDAHLFMVHAVETIQKNQNVFRPYVESSPIYQLTEEEQAAIAEENKVDTEGMVYGTSDDAIFNPFGR